MNELTEKCFVFEWRVGFVCSAVSGPLLGRLLLQQQCAHNLDGRTQLATALGNHASTGNNNRRYMKTRDKYSIP